MAAHINLGARPPGEEIAANLVVQPSSLDRDARCIATKEHSGSPRKDRTVLQQFFQNLMLALGAPHA